MTAATAIANAIRRLGDVGLTDAAEVGGKAASLGELLALGVRVPDGLVMTAGAATLPAEDRGSLLRASVAELGDGRFAVRSSGISEDGAEHSFAGIYETVLDVLPDDVPAAADRVLQSARAARVAEYEAGGHRMAVMVQRMIRPAAAGVILTADPINGDRASCIVTAVRGIGNRLVSGEAIGDEWVVTGDVATPRRQPEKAIDRRQAIQLASEARRIASARGAPQDIEWAIDDAGTVWILQARPMTALPPDVSWESPARGAYTRQLRFGEWISDPVTPLFESWLLSIMEERLHAELFRLIGQRAPLPHHVIVNGWYFYSLNWFSPASLVRNMPRLLGHIVREPRAVAGLIPPTVHYAIPIFERMWRDDLQPRYRAAVVAAEARVETVPVSELPSLIDELANLAGESFTSIAALSGAAYKMEINLARFYRKHVAPSLGGSHLPLLAGFEPPTGPGRHAVVSLDWWYPPTQLPEASKPAEAHARIVETRTAAEAAAFAALAESPRRLRAFRALLAETQRLVPVREEQTRELTLAWPVMRRAVVRIGEALVATGTLEKPDDVFFLTRTEALAALGGEPLSPSVDVADRRATRDQQAKLMPPMWVGQVSRAFRAMPLAFARMIGAKPSDRAIVSGSPAAPGRAAGAVRVIRGPDEFDQLEPGEILVAPMTAPAWTPLFTRAAAVVTDVGSAASHASIIAREYGIPAVVGTAMASTVIQDGQEIEVDGNAGVVRIL